MYVKICFPSGADRIVECDDVQIGAFDKDTDDPKVRLTIERPPTGDGPLPPKVIELGAFLLEIYIMNSEGETIDSRLFL